MIRRNTATLSKKSRRETDDDVYVYDEVGAILKRVVLEEDCITDGRLVMYLYDWLVAGVDDDERVNAFDWLSTRVRIPTMMK